MVFFYFDLDEETSGLKLNLVYMGRLLKFDLLRCERRSPFFLSLAIFYSSGIDRLSAKVSESILSTRLMRSELLV